MKKYCKPAIFIYEMSQDVVLSSLSIQEENLGGYLDDWKDILG